MVTDAQNWLEGAGLVVDLFAGLGTFAFALRKGRKTLGVEAERAAHLACKAAGARTGGAVHAIHRDLFRNPLRPEELNRFSAAVLDPPRAGAKAQVAQIAASDLKRVIYVSCNPSSWVRDAATLAAGGYKLEKYRQTFPVPAHNLFLPGAYPEPHQNRRPGLSPSTQTSVSRRA